MSHPLKSEPLFERSSFVTPCVYCGARLAVFVSREVGSGEEQTYVCPECGKGYRVHAAFEPVISVMAPRTDGKGDHYQETMF